MELNLTEEQEMLKRAARDFLERECPTSLVREMEADERGMVPSLWKQMADLGWTGIVLPEKYGGGGGDFMDLALLLEEIGRAIVPGPFLQTVVSCGMAILEFGQEAQRQRYLPGIASGETLMALAFLEPGTSFHEAEVSTKATPAKGGYSLKGIKLFVPYAHVADYLVVVARTAGRKSSEDGVSIFIVDAGSPGVDTELQDTRGKNKQHEVRLANVIVPKENILGEVGKGWPILERIRTLSAAAQCAESVGACGAVTDMTVEYAKSRTQFGRPIGSFQAVQRHCTDMLADTDGARFITYEAAWRIAEGLPADLQVGMAKSFVADSSRRVIASGHQVHGAIGFTEEHALPLYSRRSSGIAVNYGDANFHREIVAREMGL